MESRRVATSLSGGLAKIQRQSLLGQAPSELRSPDRTSHLNVSSRLEVRVEDRRLQPWRKSKEPSYRPSGQTLTIL